MVPTIENLEEKQQLYRAVGPLLEAEYGRKEWQKRDGMDELVSCILSQSTTDANRDRAFDALRSRYSSWEAVHRALPDELIETVRPAGLANSKGPNIQATLGAIFEQQGDYNIDFLQDLEITEAKNWLQQLPGVGPKTAAIVLCFGYNMPAFPVDTHVHRVGKRIGFLPEKINANKAHDHMEAIVPPTDYHAFHLQMIYHGRAICGARNPECIRCPLVAHCAYFASLST